jgi:hypothetical protein
MATPVPPDPRKVKMFQSLLACFIMWRHYDTNFNQRSVAELFRPVSSSSFTSCSRFHAVSSSESIAWKLHPNLENYSPRNSSLKP